MARIVSTSWAFVFAVLAGVALAPGHAAEVSAAKKGGEEQSASTLGLPAEVATKHVITLAGEKLAFTARAGAVRLSDAQSGALISSTTATLTAAELSAELARAIVGVDGVSADNGSTVIAVTDVNRARAEEVATQLDAVAYRGDRSETDHVPGAGIGKT